VSEAQPTVTSRWLAGGHVLDLVLGGSKGNIISTALMADLTAALDAAACERDLRMVVLRAEGRHFSFGASVEEHRRDQAADMLTAFHATARMLASYPVPIAALVQGRCLGGAFEVVLCAHFVFATADAIFACPEIKLGVFPPVLAALGPLRLGGATAERLLLTGAELTAADALRLGWATAVLESSGEQAVEEVMGWYGQHLAPLSAWSLRQAVTASRRAGGVAAAMDGALDAAESQYVAGLIPSHDGNEGIEAFLERRTPQWHNA